MAAMAAILKIYFCFFSWTERSIDSKVARKSIGLSVQEKKQKIDFQDGCHGGCLGFPIGTILAIFDLQVTQMLPT